ncbi:MAG: hypothetical protein AAF840_11750 [Bacteroidota bacterium]
MRYLIICLLFPCLLSAQQLDVSTQYVWASSGLTMRAAGNADGEKMLVIPFGAAVQLTGNQGAALRVKAMDGVTYNVEGEIQKGEPYFMYGSYLEVIYQGKTGFVFNGYLGYYSPVVKEADENGLWGWLKTHGGQPDTILNGTYGESLYRGRMVIHYENGVTYSSSEYEGGGSMTITFPVGSINSGFLFAQQFMGIDDAVKNKEENLANGYIYPELLQQDENGNLHFVGEMSETVITIVGDLLIISSSGGC